MADVAIAPMQSQAAAGQPKYLALQTGASFIDGAREFERTWLYTCKEKGIWRLWWLIYCQVLGIDPRTGATNSNQELHFAGQHDEYALFRVQLARRFIQQRKMMAQGERLNFTGVATNNDVRTLAEVKIATKAVEFLLRQSNLEQQANKGLESLANFGASALLLTWDYEGGELVPAEVPELDAQGQPVQMPVIDEATGQPAVDEATGEPQMQPMMKMGQKKSGAPKIRKLYPWQFAFDPYLEEDHPQIIAKTPVNKYELAAAFPEVYDRIVACSIDSEMGDDALFAWGGMRTVSSDTVVLRQYFCRNSKAVPGGRWAGYVRDVPLWGVDEIVPCPLDYTLPVKPMIGPNYFGTGFGYPESSDLLSLQTVINEVISMCVTNIQKRGNSNAYKRDDVPIDAESWSKGGSLIDLPGGAEPPKWDEPPKMDSLSQYILEFCLNQARLMLGSNSVTEGNPDANITSGSFAVLLVNVAQKYANDMQEAYDRAVTEVANDALELTRKNAENGFWAEVGGIGNAPYASIIRAEQLQNLRRVTLQRSSPVLSTFPGRTEVFDRIVNLPKPDRADAADMLCTSSMDSFTERDQSWKIRVRKENEQLLQGQNPVVTIWDDHKLEGPEHRAQYDKLRTMDPPKDAPKTPPPPVPSEHPLYQQWLATAGPEFQAWTKACQAHEAHLQAHAQALATTPPPMAIVAGWEPMAPEMGAMLGAPPPGQGQAPEDQGGGANGARGPEGGAAIKDQIPPKQPSAPKPPKLPKGAAGMASDS